MKERVVDLEEINNLMRDVPVGVEGCGGLAPRVGHVRIQDDHEGTFKGSICVGIGPDGDAWIQQDDHDPIRFRNMLGGGMSPRTYTALIILALAIEEDNKQNPQI